VIGVHPKFAVKGSTRKVDVQHVSIGWTARSCVAVLVGLVTVRAEAVVAYAVRRRSRSDKGRLKLRDCFCQRLPKQPGSLSFSSSLLIA